MDLYEGFELAIVNAMGGKKFVTDPSDGKSHKWSPNAIKGIYIFPAYVIIEWHAGYSVVPDGFTFSKTYFGGANLQPMTKDPLSGILKRRGYSNIEEILVPAGMGFDINRLFMAQKGEEPSNPASAYGVDLDTDAEQGKNVGWGILHGTKGKSRLRAVSEYAVGNVYPVDKMIQFMKSQRASGTTKLMSSLLGLQAKTLFVSPEEDISYLHKFTLNGNLYPSDKKGSALREGFLKDEDVTEDEAEEPESDTTESKTSTDRMPDKSVYAELESLYENENDPEYLGILAFLLTPAVDVTKDPTISDSGKHFLIKSWNTYHSEAKELGYKSYEDTRNTFFGFNSISVMKKVVSFAGSTGDKAFDNLTGSLKGMKASAILNTFIEDMKNYQSDDDYDTHEYADFDDEFDDPEDAEEEPDEESTEESVEEPAEEPQAPDDKFSEQVKREFGSRIGGLVEGILQKYDMVFSAGYELSKPEGVLGGPTVKYTTVQGGAIRAVGADQMNGEDKLLWESLNPLLGIKNTLPTIDLDEIASAAPGTYFPELMARIAFGYYIRDHGGKFEKKGWKSYRQEVAKPALIDIFSKVSCRALKDAGKEGSEILADAQGYAIVENATRTLESGLCRVLLLSDINTVGTDYDRKVVSVKVRLMNPDGTLDEDIVTSKVRNALSLVSGSTLNDATCYTDSSDDGVYVEVTFIADAVLENGSPLFAYKALDALKESGDFGGLSIDTALLGKDRRGRILRAGSDIDLSRYMLHLILARSRAGKGVMTMNWLGNILAGGGVLGYGDNKPDILSLLFSINPNMFGVNGNSLITEPANGNDMFEQFRDANSWVNKANIPDFMVQEGLVRSKSYSDLGVIFYIRFMLLSMGMVSARIHVPQFREFLGGDQGLSFVFDEFENVIQSFASGIGNKIAKGGAIAGTQALSQYKSKLSGGRKTAEEVMDEMKDQLSPGKFWGAAFFETLKDSVGEVKMLQNAGANNEKKVNNIFILGQHKLNLTSSVTDLKFRPAGSGRGTDLSPDDLRDIIVGLTYMGGADAFLGYADGEDDFLMQSMSRTKYAHNLLNEVARNFAYVPSINGNNARLYATFSGGIGRLEDRIAFSDKQTYFKPFLLLEDADMSHYPAKNLLQVVEKGTQGKVSDFISQNSDPGNESILNAGVGFIGYMEQAGISQSALAENLQKGADVANWVVQKALGYPGTWRDFLFDLRPEWIFSVADVSTALSHAAENGGSLAESVQWFNSGERLTRALKELAEIHPDASAGLTSMSKSGTLGAVGIDSDDPDMMSGFGNSFIDDTEEIPSTPSDEDYDEVIPVAEVPTAESGADDVSKYITSVVANKLGTNGSLGITKDNGIVINNQLLNDDKVTEPATKLNWATLLRRVLMMRLSMPSSYATRYVVPSVGWDRLSVSNFFRESKSLETVTLDDWTVSRSEVAGVGRDTSEEGKGSTATLTVDPEPSSVSMPPSIVPGSSNEERRTPLTFAEYNNSGREGVFGKTRDKLNSWLADDNPDEGRASARKSMLDAGGNRGKSSFGNSTKVRKGLAVALGAVAVNYATGGLLVAAAPILGAFMLSPLGIGVLGVGAAVKLWRGKKRRY